MIKYESLVNSDKYNKYAIPAFSEEEYRGLGNGYPHKFKCKICDEEFVYSKESIPKCPKCFNGKVSENEIIISKYITEELNTSVIRNDRTIISPQEIDILCPDNKLGIEICGVYYHNRKHLRKRGLKDDEIENYHKNKLLKCNEQGIKLLTVFDSLLKEKDEVFKNIIYRLIKVESIEADSTEEISQSEFIDLFNKYSPCEFYEESFLHYVLKHNKDPVMCFSSTFDRSSKTMIVKNVFIIGNKFVKNFHDILVNVIGFKKKFIKLLLDARYFSTNYFIKNNWKIIEHTDPNFFWIHKNNFNKFNNKFSKEDLMEKLTMFDESKGIYYNMLRNDYDKIYDCGNYVLLYDLTG